MTISALSVRGPVTITLIYVLICVSAEIFLPRLGNALYPTVDMPMISVRTTYSNVGPEEIEENVTKVLENQLGRVEGLKSITTQSSEGQSMIMMEFGYDVDLDEATDNIQEVLNMVPRRLPDDCDPPTGFKFDMSSAPIMRLTVKGDLPLNELKSIAEDTIQPYLERVSGVASADVMGGAQKIVRVDVSRNRLEAYDLTLSQISSALSGRNIQLSGGTVTQDGMDYQITTNEYFSSLDDIRRTVVKTNAVTDGTANRSNVVRLQDVADVYEEYDYSGRKVYIDGVSGLYISISNESDSNASSVAKGVYAVVGDINDKLPEGVELSIISDDTTMIDSSMNQVYTSGIQGALLAMAIIFLFLRSIKSSVIIGLSIPISVMITLMCMSFFGMTINIMTMAGLILGMGMLVDSSIVILQNIHIYRERGERSAVAAIMGSRNMMTAITASTLTTLCVFLPIIIYKAELEMLGQMFQDLVITVVISLVASLFVALTLVPALCGSILRLDTRTQKPLKNSVLRKIDSSMERFLVWLENGYAKTLRFALNNKLFVMTFVVMLLVFSVLQFSNLGMNLTPSSSTDDQVSVSITLPVGTNNELTEERLFALYDIVEEEIGGNYTNVIISVGSSNTGSIQINLPDITEQTMKPDDIKAKLRPYLSMWPDATISFSAGRGPGGSSNAVDVQLVSENAEDTVTVADEIVSILKTHVPQLMDISTDIENGNPQYRVVVDHERAAALGVSVSSIATELRRAVNGVTATSYHIGGSEYDIVVYLQDDDLRSLSDLEGLFVEGTGGRVTLDNLVTLEAGNAPRSISKEDGNRINHVTASLVDGWTVTDVQPLVEQAITDYLVLPDTVELSYGGEMRDITMFGSSIILVILVAIFLVFAVMAAQFESLVDPFIIFVSIPLLAIGVIWVYVWSGQPFTLYSAVGIVALVGVVVNNGIILVDYTNQLVKKKMPVFDACLEAGRSRLRPILMTTLTTVVGMIPMGFFPGEGGETMQPIGMTMVGGLTTGAFLTLYVSPIMYSIFNKRREKRYDDPDSLMNQLAGPIPEN